MKNIIILSIAAFVDAKSGRCIGKNTLSYVDNYNSRACCFVSNGGKWNGSDGCYNIYPGEGTGNLFTNCCKNDFKSSVKWW